jgi:hypothetical protein
LIHFHLTDGVLDEKALLEAINEIRDEVHSIALRQHILNEKLPKFTEFIITPSEGMKSVYKETFLNMMELFDCFGRVDIETKIETFTGAHPQKSIELDFTFQWKGQQESASYEPLIEDLHDHEICSVRVDEQDLPDGLLFSTELWVSKKNKTSLRSNDMINKGKESIFKYTVQGSTDLVRKKNSEDPLGRCNNRYFIEIKRATDFKLEESLREAVLQLIGGNVSNSFHSPPVLLTNLATMHFVLYISRVGDPTVKLQFKLNVLRMPTFGVALAFVEERTADMHSVTLHLGRKPTPQPSSPKSENDFESEEEKDDDDDNTWVFGNVILTKVY